MPSDRVGGPADQSALDLLSVALRTRAASVAELASLAVRDATHPAAQDRIAEELAGGVQIRLMADPPSSFRVTDGSTVALPLAWGERWPTSVISMLELGAARATGRPR